MYSFLKLSNENGVAVISLNRPKVFNAIDDELSFELQDALKAVSEDETVRVVVLTGEGSGFCSGQDLKSAVSDKYKSYSDAVRKRYNPIIMAMRNMPKPIICRMNGVAAGAGCSLALACDLIIAAEEAVLSELFINIGLVMDSGSSYFLPKLVGPQKAFELASMGTKLTAQEAMKVGMVNKVVPLSALDETVNTYTEYFKQAPTQTIGLMKKMINHSFSKNLEEMLELEAQYQDIAGASEDHKEGIRAFMEKRKPVFKGK